MSVNSFDDYPMSWRPTLPASEKPVYKALANKLEEDILSGHLLPGTKLPPQRELADFLEINVSTITRAFRLASDKGLLTSLTGSGTFVSYDVVSPVSVAPAKRQGMIDMSSMVPTLMGSCDVASVAAEMVGENQGESYYQYSYGLTPAQEKAAFFLLQKLDVQWKSWKQLLVANGGQNGITAILLTLCQRGDKIGVDPFVYPGLKQIARLLGIRLIPIAGAKREMTMESIAYAVKNHQIKGLYVMPDFQNPTSHIMSIQGRNAIAEAARRYHLWIIEDGIARLLAANPLHPIQALAPERTFFILSLSKTITPALRLAYIISPLEYAGAVRETLATLNISQSTMLLELASRLILSGTAEHIIDRLRQELRQRNALITQILSDYTLLGNEESLARWLILPNGWTGSDVERRALSEGVVIFGEQRFAVGPTVPYHAIRLALGGPAKRDAVAEGARQILHILRT